MLIFSTSFIFVVQPYIIIMTIEGQNMMEISTSDNIYYMDKFNEIIELKHGKENMIKKYHEEIDLFAHEFAEMIMNPQIDKNKNTC